MTLESYGSIEVCVDCYFAHHYGAHEYDGQWYSGESDTPCEFEPMSDIADDFHVFDNTCADHETLEIWITDEYGSDEQDGYTDCPHCGRPGWDDEGGTGITEFSHRSCDGCKSHLAGSRYRLSLWKEIPDATT